MLRTFFVVIIVYVHLANSQLSSVAIIQEQYPSDCSNGQYYDMSRLQCASCPAFTSTSNDDRKLACFMYQNRVNRSLKSV
jgi:hypothetical protein